MSLTAEEINPKEVHRLAERFETMPLPDVLKWAWDTFGQRAAIGLFYGYHYFERSGESRAEFFPLVLFATSGMTLASSPRSIRSHSVSARGITVPAAGPPNGAASPSTARCRPCPQISNGSGTNC